MTWTKLDLSESEFEEAKNTLSSVGIGKYYFNTREVHFEQLPATKVKSEYRVRDNDLHIHIFHIDKSLERPWNAYEYAYALFNSIVEEFNMEQFQDRVRVEYVPMVNAWDVVISGVASLKTPNSSRLVKMIERANRAV